MKKRILSLLLLLTLIISMFSAGTALAQENNESQSVSSLPYISQWATDDLVVGDTYNIYPQRWYYVGLNKPITEAQLRVLMAGVRSKLIKTDCVTEVNDVKYKLSNKLTVKKVLEAFYTLLTSYKFNKDIGITEGEKATDFMAKTGIFTGKEGELSLKDVCTTEQACVIATRLVTYVYDVLDAASKGFLWEIKSGENTAYLLGSIHVANYDIYPFSNKMLKAFEKSDALCVEADILYPDEDVYDLILQYGVYNDGTTLKDHVSEETYQKAVTIGAAYGLSEEIVKLMKPWYLYTVLSLYDDTSFENNDDLLLAASLGIDVKFLVDAHLTDKPVIELESVEFQYKILDSLSDELQEFLLVSTLDSLSENNTGTENNETDDNILDLMLKYWHDGDIENFKKFVAPTLVDSELPELDEEDKKSLELLEEYNTKLITDRNKVMAQKIDQLLKAEGSNTYFIVVGSYHYLSEDSVLDILNEMGYEISQIK